MTVNFDDYNVQLLLPQKQSTIDNALTVADVNNDGLMDKIVAYGGRSFSIWTAEGQQVFDSGSDFERITAALLAMNFNNNNDENKGDSRSDDKATDTS